MNPLAGIGLVLGALGALIAGVKVLQARAVVGAESARKLVHMGMGVICLSFPWVFASPWPVWALAGLACVALMALRGLPFLRRTVGGVLHDVNRASLGEIYFPVGVATVFALARGDALRFGIPVALLTFADAAGALVGKRWGRTRYVTLEGTKSMEGSLAVGVTGALCAVLPLLAAGHDLARSLVIGGTIGLFALVLEAISWRGLDNIFLPLAAFAQISIYLVLPLDRLVLRLGVLTAITALALIWRRGHLVDDSARLGGALALYFFWTVGGWLWLVAPVVLLASYVRLMPTVPGGVPRHNLVAVICVASAGLVWAVAAAFAPDPRWTWLFTLAIAVQQAVIAIVRFSQGRPHWPRTRWWLVGVVQAVGVQGLAFWLVDRGRTVEARDLALGAACVAAGAGVFMLWERRLQLPEDVNLRWWKQGLVGFSSSLAAFALMTL